MSNYQLYLGDCLEFMRTLDAGSVDAVITDPPYGIGYAPKYSGVMRGAYSVHAKNYPAIVGDDRDFDPTPFVGFKHYALFGADHFYSLCPPGGGWIVWDKRCGVIPERTQSDCEFILVSTPGAARIYRHMWDGMVKDSERRIPREHPTQKPIELMRYIIDKMSTVGDTIFDPFMGSGTTGVACMQLGRNFIGCEIAPEYYAIAERRIAAAAAQPVLFTMDSDDTKPEQASLL